MVEEIHEYTAVIDRPIGFIHRGITYPINYGYIEGIIGGDGEEQDVYILPNQPENQIPLSRFTGKYIATIVRAYDVEEKWVLTTAEDNFTAEEIKQAVHFQEQYFESSIKKN